VILAHVDAGKTTLTEQLLFHSGAIQTPGSVDKGSTTSDNLALEKQRGITIQNISVGFDWKKTRINLIDTPGHVNFSAEVDRAVSVLENYLEENLSSLSGLDEKIPESNGDPNNHDYVGPKLTGELKIVKQTMSGNKIVEKKGKVPGDRKYRCIIVHMRGEKEVFTYSD
jgi:Elongation factor Tu GTP binding domain